MVSERNRHEPRAGSRNIPIVNESLTQVPLRFMAGCFHSSFRHLPPRRGPTLAPRPRFGPIVRGAFQDAADGFNENFNYPIRRFLGPGRRNAEPSERSGIAHAKSVSKSRDRAPVPVSRATEKFHRDGR